jgi:N-acetylmuramoyl-L-alanine amidase
MAKICIDPGHGGSDSGAVGPSGLLEKDVALAIALQLKGMLEGAGHEVVMTRDSDIDVGYAYDSATVELQARCDISNNADVDYFVSIHCNAASSAAHGTETWCCDGSERGTALAQIIDSNIATLGLTDRGVKTTAQERLYVLIHTDAPAVLVETAFISNPEEEQQLADPAFQAQLAGAIFNGLTQVI